MMFSSDIWVAFFVADISLTDHASFKLRYAGIFIANIHCQHNNVSEERHPQWRIHRKSIYQENLEDCFVWTCMCYYWVKFGIDILRTLEVSLCMTQFFVWTVLIVPKENTKALHYDVRKMQNWYHKIVFEQYYLKIWVLCRLLIEWSLVYTSWGPQ